MQDQSQQSNPYDDHDNEDREDEQPRHKEQIVVPKSKNKLKACMRCHLLKTEEQWFADQQCENCDIRGDIKGHITSKFENVVCILDPTKSWLRKRLGLNRKIVPGSYAVQVLEKY